MAEGSGLASWSLALGVLLLFGLALGVWRLVLGLRVGFLVFGAFVFRCFLRLYIYIYIYTHIDVCVYIYIYT